MKTTLSSPLWVPNAPESTRLAAFQRFLEQRYHQHFSDYASLHAWSVDQFPTFWQAIADFFLPTLSTGSQSPFRKTGAHLWENSWFEGATFNMAEQLLSADPEAIALVTINEKKTRYTWTYAKLRETVQACAAGLQAQGVKPLDRIVAILPNCAESIIAMLATAQLGAIWSSCSPDFGDAAILDRFSQLTPTVLFLGNGQYYAGKTFEHTERAAFFLAELPSLKTIVQCPVIAGELLPAQEKLTTWQTFLAFDQPVPFTPFPFSHPLYILFSSGTTGKPKCIIHGAGNTLLQHLKELGLHTNLQPPDNLLFYTTCGWMMWNWMVSGLALGITLTLYDGAPLFPTPARLWEIIASEKVTVFGTSAKYLAALEKAQFHPPVTPTLRTILSTGSPLLAGQYDYVYQTMSLNIQLSSISGGTDIVSCFALGNPMLPVYRGEIQCLGLGMDVQIFDPTGHAICNQTGELVCQTPFPSMPLGFWNDPQDHAYQQAYFQRFPNIWTHGDFAQMTPHHGLVIEGRSDTTLNRGGVRIGSAEIYRIIETMPAILESAVVGQAYDDDVRIILFVKLSPNTPLTETLENQIKHTLKKHASPRHVPDLIIAVPDLPKTFNGKVSEIAIQKTIEHRPIDNLNALINPEVLAYFTTCTVHSP